MGILALFKIKPKYPPSPRQLRLFEYIQLPVPAKASQEKLSKLLERAIRKEPYKSRYEILMALEEAEIEHEDRECYGNELYDESLRWEALCDPSKQYELIYRKGKNILADIVELESADIVGDSRFRVEISFLLPKLRREKSVGEYLEWEKEAKITPNRVLSIFERPAIIDIFDVEAYKSAKEKCEGEARRFAI